MHRPILRSMPQPAKKVDNETLIEEYLEWKKINSPRASKVYRVWVKRFQEFTNKAPEDLVLGDWTTFAKTLEGRFSPMTLQLALTVIKNYLRYWHEQNRLHRFPLWLARAPRALARSHNAIEEEEYVRMVRVLRAKGEKHLRDLVILMLLHDTGMRVGEVVKLEIEQIEEEGSAVIETEKTIRRRRVFWNEATHDALYRLIVERVNGGARTDWLFVSSRGEENGPIRTKTVQRMVRSVAKEAGIERKISPHSFRHALIHRLARMGVPDALIAQVVGHGSPHTISHYTKLSRPELEEVARKQFGELLAAA